MFSSFNKMKQYYVLQKASCRLLHLNKKQKPIYKHIDTARHSAVTKCLKRKNKLYTTFIVDFWVKTIIQMKMITKIILLNLHQNNSRQLVKNNIETFVNKQTTYKQFKAQFKS